MLHHTELQKTLGSQLEVIKLGSCDKHPKCCWDWIVDRFITIIKPFSLPPPPCQKKGMQIILSRPCYLYCTTTRAIGAAACLCEKLINIIYFFRGQSPADAEFNFLEVAKNLDLYGVDLHFAKVFTSNGVRVGVVIRSVELYNPI